MKQIKYLLISTITASTIVLAGCTAVDTTNTNTNSTNTAVVNSTNTAATNSNTTNINTEDVDTSDWLTYMNDAIPLTFRYPKDWQLVRTEDGSSDFTELLDNNNIYDHELVNIYINWSSRHEDIIYDSGVTDTSLDKWLSCDYVYDLQLKCNTVLINGIEVVKREGQIEPPFGDDYVALAYKQNDLTVVIDARSLLRESINGDGNKNLDGLNYINAVIETMSIN